MRGVKGSIVTYVLVINFLKSETHLSKRAQHPTLAHTYSNCIELLYERVGRAGWISADQVDQKCVNDRAVLCAEFGIPRASVTICSWPHTHCLS
jgi:hypothetical protein